MKTCTKCEAEKPLGEFGPDKRGKFGRKSWCRECDAADTRHRYATDPEHAQRKRDLCAAWRHGEKLDPLPKPTADQRFDEKWEFVPETGCHVWTSTQNKRGYGQFKDDGKLQLAHRWGYEREYGPVIDGMVLHHVCHNPACCNPEHLEAMTEAEHNQLHAERCVR